MMKKRALTIMLMILFVLVSLYSIGSVGASEMWSQTYGGFDLDVANSLIETSDGGYAVAGETASFGAGDYDVWLVKTDAHGDQQWNQTYGGTADDFGESLIQTGDGGYAIAGRTWSYGNGEGDFWLVKTDKYGNMEWNQTYGEKRKDQAYSLIETSDGGFVLVGDTTSYDAEGIDVRLVKTDSSGNFQWSQMYGGTSDDYGYSVIQTSDGGYAIAGRTASYPAVLYDSLLIKTDADGNQRWNQTYGGTASDSSRSVIQANDGGYILAGYTISYGAGSTDFWLVKTSSNGNQQWNKTYGGTSGDYLSSMVETSDGGFALAGRTWSYGAGEYDVWLVKTDAEGNMEWNQTYGGTGWEEANSLVDTSDGGYAIAGSSTSLGIGSADFWLIKTDEYGIIPEFPSCVILPLFLTATLIGILVRNKAFTIKT
jgi:hypothetical protein